jgi:energy-coupling factor transporter ATP-binding protein EcfA2
MTMQLRDLLRGVFIGTTGRISLSDQDGSTFSSDDFDALTAWCVQADDPWIDLVTESGECVGIYVAGDHKAVEPQPSCAVSDGMIYLLDDVVPNMEQGPNVVPVDTLFDALDEEETPILFDPKTLDVQTEGSKKQIKLANGRHRQEGQGRWKANASTFGQFSDFLRIHREGPKDGPCFLQGDTAGGHRKAAAMVSNYVLGVDLDSGAPVEDVIASIQKAGLEAVIYTTHSHLKSESKIKRDHFIKWAEGEETNEELVAEYLVKVKGVLPHIVEQVAIIDEGYHTEEGVVILVQHRPMPKFRAVFPLHEPFVFAKRGGTQQDAIAEWKERYAGFATAMGFFFDEKCVDPARLFYFPRHKKGDPHGSWRIAGQPLHLDDYDRVRIKRDRNGVKRSVSQNAFTEAGIDEDDAARYMTEKGYNLKPWAAKTAKRFEVEQMLQDLCPDMIREPRTGGKPGTHIECPFEAEHSDFGGGGTYVVNAGDNLADGWDGGFSIHCVHNACSGRNRLDFIREMVDQEWVTTSDIQNKDYLLELEGDEEEEDVRPDDPTPADTTPRGKRDAARVAALDAEDAEDIGDDEEKALRAFNRRYAVIITSGGVKVLREPDRDDPNGDVQFLSQNDVALFERNNVVWFGDKKTGKSQKVEVFKLWLEWEKRRTYKNVVFLPGENTPPHIYNLFRGWAVDPIKGDWSLLKNHIFENICEADNRLFGWFMTWLAHIIQQPTLKPGSTVVITGRKGTGKSTLFDYMNQLLGRHGITVSQRKQIVGQFNGHLATALLMVCEEAFWAADPQAEGVMKDMITNRSMLIERKGCDPIQSLNYTRMALISNNDWVVPASLKDERRFGVFRCSEARRGDIEFFDAMRRQMEREGGLEAMLYDLLNWEPLDGSWGVLYTPPLTAALQQQQVETLSGIQKFMLELVKSGVYETNNDNIEPIELNLDRETTIYAVEMRSAVEDYLRFGFQSDKAKATYDDISKVVKDWFGAKETMLDIEGQLNKKRSFIFPPLNITRANLKESKGLDIEVMSVEEVKKLKAR